MKIPNTIFVSEEELSGTFHLKTKKVVRGKKLKVKLVGFTNPSRGKQHAVEIFNEEHEVEGMRSYSRNYSNYYLRKHLYYYQ